MAETGTGGGGSTTSTMDKANEAAQTAKDQAGQVADKAKQEAGTVVAEAKTQTKHLAREAKSQLQQQVDDGAQKVAGSLRSVGEELETMAGAAHDSNALAATAVREVGTRAGSLATRIEQGGVQSLASDVRRFAAQRPGLFLAGALAAGVVVGRMVRNVDLNEVKDAVTGDGSSNEGSSSPTGAPANGMSTSTPPAPPPAPAPPTPPASATTPPAPATTPVTGTGPASPGQIGGTA